MNHTTDCIRKTAIPVLVLILIIIAALSPGCINKIFPKNESATQSESPPEPTPEVTVTALSDIESPAPLYIPQAATEILPQNSSIVTEVAPFTTPDPYPIMHATRINETRQYRLWDRVPEFVNVYHLRGNATGLLINVVQGPLLIEYLVGPQNDCLKSPDSCRGDMEKPVQRPYVTITVRDNTTQEIVAEDGYGREFSSDKGWYEFTISGENMDGQASSGGEEGTNVVYPGPRKIMIYREGVYHVTLEGNYANVLLGVVTGASPDPLEVGSEPEEKPFSEKSVEGTAANEEW